MPTSAISVSPKRTPVCTSTLLVWPSFKDWSFSPLRSHTISPRFLSVPMIVLMAGSRGFTQIAGSSAASPRLRTGLVSIAAATLNAGGWRRSQNAKPTAAPAIRR